MICKQLLKEVGPKKREHGGVPGLRQRAIACHWLQWAPGVHVALVPKRVTPLATGFPGPTAELRPPIMGIVGLTQPRFVVQMGAGVAQVHAVVARGIAGVEHRDFRALPGAHGVEPAVKWRTGGGHQASPLQDLDNQGIP